MAEERPKAKVGSLEFADDYSNPIVDVTNEYRTAEHDIVTSNPQNDAFVVQHLGSKPQKITIEGVIRGPQNETADRLGNEGPVYVRTQRWSGTAVITKLNTVERRSKDKKGYWLYDITISLLEIVKGERIQDRDYTSVEDFDLINSSAELYDVTNPDED